MSDCNVAQREMPTYKCHKVVHALKIRHLIVRADGGLEMTPEEEGYAGIVLPLEFVKKHDPAQGGYYVIYEDGYKSFSPAEAFEKGYSRLD